MNTEDPAFIEALKKLFAWSIDSDTIDKLKKAENSNQTGSREMFPVIMCIAKLEHDYIEEFVKYHLALGFKYIYLYDNEDVPTYEKLLHKYKDHIKVIHFPFNNYHKGVQYIALEHFVTNHLFNSKTTHVAHIDIDEFIVLKKHNNICDFINEYIKDDCQGIGINWRFFGSSGLTEKSNEPVTKRFTMCEKKASITIKTIFKKDNFLSYDSCHNIRLTNGHIKSTDGTILDTYWNKNPDVSIIQLNHYKCKTLPEFRHIRSRQRADLPMNAQKEDIDQSFRENDRNEVQELTASHFYQKHC